MRQLSFKSVLSTAKKACDRNNSNNPNQNFLCFAFISHVSGCSASCDSNSLRCENKVGVCIINGPSKPINQWLGVNLFDWHHPLQTPGTVRQQHSISDNKSSKIFSLNYYNFRVIISSTSQFVCKYTCYKKYAIIRNVCQRYTWNIETRLINKTVKVITFKYNKINI